MKHEIAFIAITDMLYSNVIGISYNHYRILFACFRGFYIHYCIIYNLMNNHLYKACYKSTVTVTSENKVKCYSNTTTFQPNSIASQYNTHFMQQL